MKRKRTLTNIAVLCFYLFYSLFPLLYCLEFSDPADQAGSPYSLSFENTQRPAAGRNVFSIGPDDREDSSSPFSYVLLKKKRAIPISFKIVPQLSAMFSGFTPTLQGADAASGIVDDRVTCLKGFQFCHSGVSPPSA